MDKLFKSTVEILCVQSNAVHLSSRWGFVRVSITLLYTFRPAGAALKSFSTSFFNRLNRTKYKGYRKKHRFPQRGDRCPSETSIDAEMFLLSQTITQEL